MRHFSTTRLIKEELAWYESEGLNAPNIILLDNALVLDLFDHEQRGIFTLLEDECKRRIPSTMNLMQILNTTCCQNAMFTSSKTEATDFLVRHTTKNVVYSSVK